MSTKLAGAYAVISCNFHTLSIFNGNVKKKIVILALTNVSNTLSFLCYLKPITETVSVMSVIVPTGQCPSLLLLCLLHSQTRAELHGMLHHEQGWVCIV